MNDLHGISVLVTRPAHQAENLCRLIEARQGRAIRFPTLDIVAVNNSAAIAKTLDNLDKFQWLVFISANAVNFALIANSGKIARFSELRIAAIGRATAKALETAGLRVDLLPLGGHNSEALLAMPEMRQVNGLRFLIVRGEGGREELADILTERGAAVEYLNVYKREIPGIDSSPVINLLTQNRIGCITVTSSEALKNLLIMLGKNNHGPLSAVPLVVVSDRIRQIAADMGFKRIYVTNSPSDAAILETVTTCMAGE